MSRIGTTRFGCYKERERLFPRGLILSVTLRSFSNELFSIATIETTRNIVVILKTSFTLATEYRNREQWRSPSISKLERVQWRIQEDGDASSPTEKR